jgi:hypothetical protein
VNTHSASHQLNRVVRYIKTNRESQKSTGMAFLDVKKAFDSVWHEGLLPKLLISNCYLYLTKIIASFLSSRSFHVSVNKTDSDTHPFPYPFPPQGAILSNSLYNFFAADSAQSNESETGTFADDTAILVSSGDPGMVCNIPTITRPRFFFHVLQAVEDKNQRGQDPGNIFHPMFLQGNCQLLISGLGVILSHGPQK